jgi:hypothetical protein
MNLLCLLSHRWHPVHARTAVAGATVAVDGRACSRCGWRQVRLTISGVGDDEAVMFRSGLEVFEARVVDAGGSVTWGE